MNTVEWYFIAKKNGFVYTVCMQEKNEDFMYDLIIIGGGASGLCLAICAERRGKKVIILEKEDKVGKKILMTGNGRCNLSATDICACKYNTVFADNVIKEDVIKFFESIGLAVKNIGNRIYPYHESANGVVAVLRKNLENTPIITDCYVNEIKEEENYYSVCGYKGKNIALCTGSAATKGTESYFLYQKFGHRLINPKPSIVHLLSASPYIKGLANLRAKVCVSLLKEGKSVYSQSGEILFKENGLSGICSMMLSTYIAREGGNFDVSVDFLPDKSEEEADRFIEKFGTDGLLLKPIGQNVAKQAKNTGRKISFAAKNFIVSDVKTAGIKNAQTVCGGLDITQFDENLQSKLKKGLYACGEVLDVDGECGGYNLHFAFGSALKVGRSI